MDFSIMLWIPIINLIDLPLPLSVLGGVALAMISNQIQRPSAALSAQDQDIISTSPVDTQINPDLRHVGSADILSSSHRSPFAAAATLQSTASSHGATVKPSVVLPTVNPVVVQPISPKIADSSTLWTEGDRSSQPAPQLPNFAKSAVKKSDRISFTIAKEKANHTINHKANNGK